MKGVLLIVLAGVVAVSAKWSTVPGFSTTNVYKYQVIGKSFSALNQVQNQWSGVVYRALFEYEPNEERGNWGKITKLESLDIHGPLPENWEDTPKYSDLQFKSLPSSGEPFQIMLTGGQIASLKVLEGTPIWEINLIRSVVSQLQVVPAGKYLLPSQLNAPRHGEEPYAVYKVMEPSVSGKCEVLYDLSPLPKTGSTERWIKLSKSRNFTNCEQLPVYHFGLPRSVTWEPGTNEMGEFLSRSEISTVVKSGLNGPIQTSETTSSFFLSPHIHDHQKGSVISSMRLNLTGVALKMSLENTERRQKYILVSLVSSFSDHKNTNENEVSSSSSSESESLSQEEWHQRPQAMEDAPWNPIFVIPPKQALKNIDVILTQMATMQETSQESLEKFMILTELLRTLSYKDLKMLVETVPPASMTWPVLRDGISESGTGPSLLIIRDLIKNQQITCEEECRMVSTQAKSAKSPTAAHILTLYQLLKSEEVAKSQPLTFATAIALSELIRIAVVDTTSAHKRYPVHAYGPLGLLAIREVEEIYIPYMEKRLKESVEEGSSEKIQLYIRVLGNMAYPTILNVFEPFLEGQIKITRHQRTLMILSLQKLAMTYPAKAQSVFFKILSNDLENHQDRVAAFYGLMETDPEADLLQRIAVMAKKDRSEHVRSAIKTTIEATARLEGQRNSKRRTSAAAAVPLLPSFVQGIQYSRQNLLAEIVNGLGLQHELAYIGSSDHLAPMFMDSKATEETNGVRADDFDVSWMGSSMRDIIDATKEIIMPAEKSNEPCKESVWSIFAESHNLTKTWNEIEANIRARIGGVERFLPMGMNSGKMMQAFVSEMMKGKDISEDLSLEHRAIQNEITLAMPTALGQPMVFKFSQPTVMSLMGKFSMKVNPSKYIASLTSDMNFGAGVQTMGRLQFIGFNSRTFVAGNDKSASLNLPLTGMLTINLEMNRASASFELPKKAYDLAHYTVRPFTTITELISAEALAKEENFKPIHTRKSSTTPSDILEIIPGVKIRMEKESERENGEIFENMRPSLGFAMPIAEKTIEPVHGKLWLLPTEFKEIQLKWIMPTTDYFNRPFVSRDVFNKMADLTSGKRPSAFTTVSLEVKPEDLKTGEHKFVLVFGLVKDGTERTLISYLEQTHGEIEILKIISSLMMDMPAFPMHSFKKSLEPLKPGTITLKIAELTSKDARQLASATVTMRRTPERVEFVKKSSQGLQCFTEMREGNYNFYGCQNATYHAGLYDNYKVDIKQDLPKPIRTILLKGLGWLRHIGYEYLTENLGESVPENISMAVQYNPTLKKVDVVVQSGSSRWELTRVPVRNEIRSVAVMHPEMSLMQRVGFAAFRQQYQPTCSVGDAKMKTFDNCTHEFKFTTDMGRHASLVLAMSPDPLSPLQRERGSIQDKFLVALAARDGPRTLLVSLGHDMIQLTPTPTKLILVVNKDTVNFVPKTMTIVGENDKSVFVLTRLDADFYKLTFADLEIIHSSYSTMITLLNRSPTIGLCGNSDSETPDYFTPQNTIASNVDDLIDSWAWELPNPIPAKGQPAEAPYHTQIVSEQDAGRANKYGNPIHRAHYFDPNSLESRSVGSKEIVVTRAFQKRLMVVDHKGQHCFSLQAHPACKHGKVATKTQEITADFVCVEKSSTSLHWEKLVLRGAQPDFRERGTSQQLKVESPVECEQ